MTRRTLTDQDLLLISEHADGPSALRAADWTSSELTKLPQLAVTSSPIPTYGQPVSMSTDDRWLIDLNHQEIVPWTDFHETKPSRIAMTGFALTSRGTRDAPEDSDIDRLFAQLDDKELSELRTI